MLMFQTDAADWDLFSQDPPEPFSKLKPVLNAERDRRQVHGITPADRWPPEQTWQKMDSSRHSGVLQDHGYYGFW